MYYELYADSLFLVNFVMNLYLLLLVNKSLFRTATRKRLVLGAAVGAVLYFSPFLGIGPWWFRFAIGALLGNTVMIAVAFRIHNLHTFFRVWESILMYSILMGGAMLLLKRIPWMERRMMGIWGILGCGAILCLLMGYFMERRNGQQSLCKVTLICKGSRITVTALLDTGNSLVEPISGKPVSILERDVVLSLWKEEPPFYRAIPYHSIGKKRGILKGYLLPEMQIEMDGVTKICKETYVAVCDEYIASGENGGRGHVKMILNPGLLEEKQEIKKERFG